MKNLYSKPNFYFAELWGTCVHLVLRPAVFISVLLLISSNFSFAQITVTQNANAQTLAQLLTGSGVTISNYTISGDVRASGTFTNVSSNLGLGQGVVLSTGMVTSVPQAASNFASTQFTNAGDPQLATLTTGSIFDVSILQFDITPQGSTLQFNYVFASEEYPQFVCSPYNDVFGFFITGPNPAGGSYSNNNLATLPNSTLPVCINTINPGVSGTYMGNTWSSGNCQSLSNSNLYVNNLAPTVNPNIVYNGMTTVLTATASVVPCQTYHLKIAIADVGDRIYDSGVFLQAYSFTSTAYTTSITSQVNTPGYTSTYRGCVDGTFTVSISSAQTSNVTVNLGVSGTATNGVDYDSIPSSVVIPAGQTSVTIPMNPIQNNIVEPTETVILSIVNPCTGTATSSDSLTIKDVPVPKISVNDSTLCKGQSAQLTATGGFVYNWSPAAGLSNDTASSPVATPSSTTTYSVGITVGSCTNTLSQKIYVSDPSLSITASPGDTICTAGNIQLGAAPAGGITPYTYLWNNGNTASSITASSTGTYSVVATDSFGCTVNASRSIIISNVSATGNVTPVSCFGNNNGAINLSVTGLNSPYNYKWNDGPITANRSNLPGGNYTVTVTNAVACTVTATFNIIQPSSQLAVTATPHAALCNGDSTGSVSLSITGGVSPFHFTWNNADTTQNIANLKAGTYTATITDFGGCSVTASASVSQPAPVIVSGTQSNEKCIGDTNASIQLIPGGGTSPYSFNWSSHQTSQNINTLPTGNYTVTVADINSCTTTKTFAITEPTALTVVSTPTNPGCAVNATGSITLTVNGGTPAYNYLWSNNATSQNISGITSGPYSVTITDNNGCTATSSITIATSGSLTVSVAQANVTCNGASNGSISLQAGGGSSPYSYSWNGVTGSSSKNNLGVGNYNITVTDINSCSATLSAAISQPAALNLSFAATNASCFGSTNGAINPTVTGGTSPYAYNWTGGITTTNLTNLSAGNYNVTVTDSNLCTITGSATVAQPATALSAAVAVTNVTCSGSGNGTINLTPSGGTGPYSYNWGGSITSQNRSNLTPGNYTVTITDAGVCTFSTAATIVQPNNLTVNSTQINIACNGGNNGSINLQVTGGTSPYTYNWNGGANTASRNNLGAGTYSVTVTDLNSCSSTLSAIISQPAGLNLSLSSTNVSCFGAGNGTINSTVTGGTLPYTYNWGSGITTQNRNNLGSGNYTVIVTDSNLCSVTGSAVITQPVAALSDTASVTNASCNGNNNGAIALTVTGGTSPYSYNWGGGITTQNRNNLQPGNYTVTITDANLCSTATSATVAQPGNLSMSSTQTNITCNGANNGSINLQVSGGILPYTYNWNGGASTATITNLASGTYNVTVTDKNSCSSSLSAVISQPAALNLSMTETNVTCFGSGNGAINMAVTGGTPPYTYRWAGGITTQNRINLNAGNYNVTVTDSNSCIGIGTAPITQPISALNATPTVIDINCYNGNNGAITMVVTGGSAPYSYNWGAGITSQNRNNLQAGNYNVTVSDVSSCSVTAAANVTQPSSAMAITPNISDVSCNGGNNGSISLNVNGGSPPYSYAWSNNSNTRKTSSLTAGTYSVTVVDTKGCVTDSDFSISQPAPLTVSLNANNITCYGSNNGNIKLTVSGGTIPYLYKWDNGDATPNISQLPAGTYTVEVVDSNNCTATGSLSLAQPTQIQISGTANNTLCSGANNGSIDISVTGGAGEYSYTWSNYHSSADLTNIPAGIYNLTVTDANSCTATASETVSSPKPISITGTQTNEMCHGAATATVDISATGGTGKYSYSWSNSATGQQLNGLKAGNYFVTVSDINACTATREVIITEPAAITLTENHTDLRCNGSGNGAIALSVAGGVPAYHFAWSNGDTTQNISSINAGNYSVSVTDANGCFASLNVIPVTSPSVLTIAITPNEISCFGRSNGKAVTTITGGTAPYQFQWSNYEASQDLTNVTAGTYTLTVTDTHGCSDTGTVTINTLPPMQVSGNTGPLPCANAYGSISLNVSSGTPPYSFRWSNDAETEDLYHVHPGTYTVTISDANNCTFDTSFVITDLNSFEVKASGGGTIELGQTVNLYAVSTGSSLTNFNWTPANGLTCPECDSTTAQPAETILYTVIATDTNGCTAEDTVSVGIIANHTYWTPNAFTPNGDGNNDYFQMYGNLEGVHDIQIMIFDRWGEEVFESNQSDFKWDGAYKGKLLPPAVYAFVLKLVFLDGTEKAEKGSITLLR